MKSKKLSFLVEYPKFRSSLSDLKDIIFFFPFYHFGGAERVHTDILKIFPKKDTSCFITKTSENDFFRKEFEENTNIIPYFKIKSGQYKIYVKTLAKAINKKKSPVVFGCNNPFFYQMIPYLENHVKIIDLIHAFSYEEPLAAEKISLPVAGRIDTRIVLGQKTKNDFAELYRKNHLSEKLLDRIEIIKNKVEIPKTYVPKMDFENLKILFVARNSFEKRPHYVTEIAKKCLKENLNITFSFVGNFEENFSDLENVKIIGAIDSYEKMQKIYLEHHLLLITSFREGFPMVISEGMANGVVPVTINIGEISEIITPENKNGFLINDANLSLYSSVKERVSNKFMNYEKEKPITENFLEIIKFIMKNPDLYKEYSQNTYETAKKYFSGETFEMAYRKILEKK